MLVNNNYIHTSMFLFLFCKNVQGGIYNFPLVQFWKSYCIGGILKTLKHSRVTLNWLIMSMNNISRISFRNVFILTFSKNLFYSYFFRKGWIHKTGQKTRENPNLVLKSGEQYRLWQYWLWSFQGRDTKLERFLAKN